MSIAHKISYLNGYEVIYVIFFKIKEKRQLTWIIYVLYFKIQIYFSKYVHPLIILFYFFILKCG